MFVSMDHVVNINNGPSGHVDESNVDDVSMEEGQPQTLSRLANGTTSSGKFENQQCVEGDGERVGRKRKTRRFKSRFKGKSFPLNPNFTRRTRIARIYPQSVAPYNTNEFLMDEHTIDNLDDTLLRVKRHRECSFTSADSDEEQFYSSPEDEDEFLSRDFDETYQSVREEKLGNLSKAQLTKVVFELQAKVDELNKTSVPESRLEEMSNMLIQMKASGNKDEIKTDIEDLLRENQRMRREIEDLKKIRVRKISAPSSSSSSSSDGESETDSEKKVEGDEAKNLIDQKAAG